MSQSIFDSGGNKEPAPVPIGDEELKQMFSRVYSYHDEVEKKLEEAYKYTGLSAKDVKAFIENPNNFPPQGYEIIAKQKERLFEQVEEWATHQPGMRKKKKKKSQESDKTRKGKTLGARKKWLQM